MGQFGHYMEESNFYYEEMKGRTNLRNAWQHSVQNILFPRLFSEISKKN